MDNTTNGINEIGMIVAANHYDRSVTQVNNLNRIKELTKMHYQTFKAKIKKLGAEIDEAQVKDTETYMVDTPKGKIFNANGCHCISVPFGNWHGQFWRDDAMTDMLEQLSQGLDDCLEPNCDVCEEK